MTLSLCMVVKNEEANLPQCLSSVRAVVDEIVVLDTGSTDRTPQIAEEWGARVYYFDWCNDFAIARNQVLQYAQGDWILVLDADETLVPEVVPFLEQAMQVPSHLVVNLVRQEIGATQSPYSLVSRLFRKHPQIRFTRPYHAMIDDSVAQLLEIEPDWQVVELPQVAILHDGYRADAIAGRDKFARACAAMESFFAQNPYDPYVCSKLGALYVQMGKVDQGLSLLEQGLGTNPSDPPILYELHYHLGVAYSRAQNLTQAQVHYRAALEQPILLSLKLGAYNNLGNLLKDQGDLSSARQLYAHILQIDPTFAAGHYNLGMTLKAMGRLTEAIAAYQTALQLNPEYAEAYQNLGVVLLKVGNVAGSMAAFQSAIALYEQRQSPEAARLRQGLQEMGLL